MHQPEPGATLVGRAPSTQPEDATGNPAVTSRLPLSCDRIVEAALAFVDHNCLGELSMRRLGGELGVEAMSLYRYFPSKNALLEAVLSRALGELALPAPDIGAGWEPEVRAYARSFRAVARQHPHLIPLMATMGPANPTLASIHARMVRLWRDAGLDAATAPRAQSAIQGYLTGISLWDASVADAATAADGAATEGPAAGSSTVAGARTTASEAPPQAVTVPAQPAGGPADDDFEFGLDVLMGGLREHVAGSQPRP